MNQSYSVIVLVVSPEGIPLIRDPKKPAPVYWKIPGGRSEANETPEECAVREIKEELGLKIDQDDLRLLVEEDRGSHVFYAFKIELLSLKGLKKVGDEQEEIKVFSSADLKNEMGIFPNHKMILSKNA